MKSAFKAAKGLICGGQQPKNTVSKPFPPIKNVF
jgi:hypothetical protein